MLDRVERRTVRALAAWLVHSYKVSPAERERLAAGMVDGQYCDPEPGERTAYMLGCLLAPALLAGCSFGLTKIPSLGSRATRIAAVLLEVSLAALLLGVVWIGLTAEQNFVLSGNLFYERPWSALLLAPLAIAAYVISRRLGPIGSMVGRVLGVACCGVVGVACISGVANRYAWENLHFCAVFDPVSQVSLGRHLLVDCNSQYGLYADFLAPIFGVIGLSITRFTAVLGLIEACSFAAIWFVLDGAVSRGVLKWLGLLSLLYNGWALFLLKLVPCHTDYFECYFQYMPLRFCFPAGLLLLYWSWLNRPRAWLYWFTAFFVAVGVLWNIDSGIVVWLTWLAALWLDAWHEPDWSTRLKAAVRHTLAVTATLAMVIAAYAVAKYLTAGQWPDFAGLFAYQRLFYIHGFNMLPMPLPGIWILVVLVYLAGLARGLAALGTGDPSPRPALVFFISILGCGLFSYFQGRSHPLVLLLAWWPALVLLPLLLDEALDYLRLQPRSVLAYATVGVLGWCMIGSAASLIESAPKLGTVISQQLATIGDPHSPVTDDAQLLVRHVARQDKLLILSYRASLVHWAAHIPSVAPASVIQMLEVEQYRDLLAALDSPNRTWVLMDHDFKDQILIGSKFNPGSKLLLEGISARMRRVGDSERACLYELTPETHSGSPQSSRMTSNLQPLGR